METGNALVEEIRGSLLKWYNFAASASILYVGEEGSPIAKALLADGRRVCCRTAASLLDGTQNTPQQESVDYIVSIADLERQAEPSKMLQKWRTLMKPDGILLLGVNNRFGIRYFCGDKDPYTQAVFDGVENYHRVYSDGKTAFRGRAYSHIEVRQMLRDAGWLSARFFSVLPDLDNPYLLLSEDYRCKEDLEGRVVPMYNCPDTVFLEEETMYWSLMENGMFHEMANAYLIECTISGTLSEVRQVTISSDRKREDAFLTIIHGNDTVEKRAIYPEGVDRLQQIVSANEDLVRHGIKVVPGKLEGDRYIMLYIAAETGQAYLKRLFRENRTAFFLALDQFKDCVLRSSEWITPNQGDGNGVTLRKGYVDLIPLNSFYVDGEFVFFDQEFCVENYPANAILIRVVHSFYSLHPELYTSFPLEQMVSYFGLEKYREKWDQYNREFIDKLLQKEELAAYYRKHRRNAATVKMNRDRMNLSEEMRHSLFDDLFYHADTRKLVLFGAGKYAQRFLEMYGRQYPPVAIVDNNPSKWGTMLDEYRIESPELLRNLLPGEYKVIICAKEFLPIVDQLETMGVNERGVYDPQRVYPVERQPIVSTTEQSNERKKFHVGYVAGVFDLFHIGHLNILRRAKEQCDYLIVGVVTDYGVRTGKKVEPFIPFEERIEIVQSCQYVNEAVEIPKDRPDTEDAWEMYHFDVQFSGSDYEHDPRWLEKKAFLEAHGATMVFFPYTESTSSTRLKKLITQKLI